MAPDPSTDLRMILVVFPRALEDQVRGVLEERGLDAFSEIPKIVGSGEGGRVEDTRTFPGANAALFSALPRKRVEKLVAALMQFIEGEEARAPGRHVSIRAFELPCRQLI